MLKLVIGNKNYSSWSIRAWLYLVESGIDFEEVRIPLFEGNWREALARFSPAGRVPVLVDGDVTVWDSLAIIEYLRRQGRSPIGWPADASAAALAQSTSYEMHSSFLALRDELPQNLRKRRPLRRQDLSQTCRQQIERIDSMWAEGLKQFGGPGLFGEFSIADVMYAPVALRFLTYQIELSEGAQRFVEWVSNRPAVSRLCKEAAAESECLDFIDELKPAAESPLVLG